jgi:hypothetical protein
MYYSSLCISLAYLLFQRGILVYRELLVIVLSIVLLSKLDINKLVQLG